MRAIFYFTAHPLKCESRKPKGSVCVCVCASMRMCIAQKVITSQNEKLIHLNLMALNGDKCLNILYLSANTFYTLFNYTEYRLSLTESQRAFVSSSFRFDPCYFMFIFLIFKHQSSPDDLLFGATTKKNVNEPKKTISSPASAKCTQTLKRKKNIQRKLILVSSKK